MEKYRIMLADDHALFRQGLRKIIDGFDNLIVAGEASDGPELLELVSYAVPHLVILDISMPKLRGIEVLRRIKREHPDVKVLILTMYREYLHQALAAGAEGFLVKEDADRELFSAIQNIRRGNIYVSPRLRTELTDSGDILPEALSQRETDVMKLIAGGKSNREISEMFSISVRTVEAHRASILGKLNLKNTAELVRCAIEKGIVYM